MAYLQTVHGLKFVMFLLYAIVASSKLRIRYGILAALFLVAAIAGLNCLLRAGSIIWELWGQNEYGCEKLVNKSFSVNTAPWNCFGPVR
uniref:Heparan-alpha-glucosaminide N-acetyltransferase catalytic domain-containing protein n=1 Tax=Setaria digitata TaxID=48799 RepID=A0A915Q795_9BILA